MVQHFTQPGEARPRVERKKAAVRIAGHDISAEDDGGICWMVRDSDWNMRHPYLALLEAKKAFQSMNFDERTGKLMPVVSNNVLAPYLGEAVISWRADRKDLKHE
ncbi:uncharacterized protein LDX57_002542 [Aspergillus melleus]|uniref:uncharacterized protein n=1 Tax=Aspergillus melleus TaxID=138277 RepID=UPI001E8E792A|nr:uncharacterized protein LDX57_002542 [Aspergillus melleus]KAH8424799.1 hypothetical protein LDX57_002542 [Aspergillus melleus]